MAEARYQEAIEEARTRQGLLGAAPLRARASPASSSPTRCSPRPSTAPSASGWSAPATTWRPARRSPCWCGSTRCGCAWRCRSARRPASASASRSSSRSRAIPARYTGRVARISPAISEDNRTLLVEAEVPNADGRLRPGSFAQAEIVIQAARPGRAGARLLHRHLRRHREGDRRRGRQGRREAGQDRPPLGRPGRDRGRRRRRRLRGGRARATSSPASRCKVASWR